MKILNILAMMIFIFGQMRAQDSIHYEIKEIAIDQADSAYTLNCRYPQVVGLQDKVIQARCNNSIKAIITNWVDRFRADSTEADKKAQRHSDRGGPSFAAIGYEVSLAAEQIFSVWFSADAYFDGFHDIVESMSLTFDIQTGQEIQLSDLFEPNSPYLDTLSRYCMSDLASQGVDTFWVKGSFPFIENSQTFTIGRTSLNIVFDEFGLYSDVEEPNGGYIVKIPYTKLNSILRKNGPIDSLLK